MTPEALREFISRLPELAERLRVHADIERGADVWLAIHDLLWARARRDALPNDPLRLAATLGPILCRTPLQQEGFKTQFEHWWQDLPAPAPEAEIQPGGTAPASMPKPKVGRATLGLLLAILAVAAGVLLKQFVLPPPPTPAATHSPQVVSAVPESGAKPPPKPKNIPITNSVPPNPLPLPPRDLSRWEQHLRWIGWACGAIPALLGLLALLWRYWRRPALSRDAPEKDTLLHRLRFAIKRRYRPFAAVHGERPSRWLHAGGWEHTRKLDEDASVEATARHAGLFQPRYRQRRLMPRYLVLVQSRHPQDQGAAYADELIARFRESGLAVQRFQFSDDPRHLRADENSRSRSLADIGQDYRDARLIVVSDSGILLNPFTGAPRDWLEGLLRFDSRVWLNPDAASVAEFDCLTQHQFLLLPLANTSVERLAHWLSAAPSSRHAPTPSMGAIKAGLPDAFREIPQRWLDPLPPHGTTRADVFALLGAYLDADGLLLLQALAAYPEIRWPLTQFLDYQLFDQPIEQREQRWQAISRLPWGRFGYIPDYLRQDWLLRLRGEDRKRLSAAFRALLGKLADPERSDATTLPFHAPSRKTIRWLLANWRPGRKRHSGLDDRIFLNVLWGKRLGLLNFALPRWLEQALPGGRWLVDAAPLLLGLALTAGAVFGATGLWDRYGRPWLLDHWQSEQKQAWQPLTVDITAAKEARELATALSQKLRADGFQVNDITDLRTETNWRYSTVYAPDASAGAQRVADWISHLGYGVSVHTEPRADLPSGRISVVLVLSYQSLTTFNDALSQDAKPLAKTFRDTLKDGGEGPEMVVIPAGSFLMGSPETEENRYTAEVPQHTVTLARDFALGRTEVTFEDFDRYAKATGRELPKDQGWGRGNRPVINVTWDDANAYADWLTKQTGQSYRLPTEAEWEYAARAGSTSRYPWGDDIGRNRANCNRCGSEWDNKQSAPVGSFAANPFGLFDTAGNVWEWTADCWHHSYQKAPNDGSAWQDKDGGNCGRRVTRGGSWSNPPGRLRSASRDSYMAGPDLYGQGFRLARDPFGRVADVGNIDAIEGTVELSSADSPEQWHAAKAGATLHKGDTIRTASKSSAKVRIGFGFGFGESLISIDENSTLTVPSMAGSNERRYLLDLIKGRARFVGNHSDAIKIISTTGSAVRER